MTALKFVMVFIFCMASNVFAQDKGRVGAGGGGFYVSHVRTTDQELEHALAYGLSQSATLRNLVAEIDRSNVIVYFFRAKCAYPAMACTSLLSGRTSIRYVRTNVQLPGVRQVPLVWGRTDIVSILGHELQHALEIGEDRSIVDEQSLRDRYRNHGSARIDGRFESQAAIDVGNRVKSDLRNREIAADNR